MVKGRAEGGRGGCVVAAPVKEKKNTDTGRAGLTGLVGARAGQSVRARQVGLLLEQDKERKGEVKLARWGWAERRRGQVVLWDGKGTRSYLRNGCMEVGELEVNKYLEYVNRKGVAGPGQPTNGEARRGKAVASYVLTWERMLAPSRYGQWAHGQ